MKANLVSVDDLVPEIEQGLSEAAKSKVTVSFTPHLMPMVIAALISIEVWCTKLPISELMSIILKSRGMQSTIYVEMAPGTSTEDLYQHLKNFYEVMANSSWKEETSVLSSEFSWLFTQNNGLVFLQNEEFVILLNKNEIPHTRHVRGSNYCLMNVFPDRIPGRAIIISVVSLSLLSVPV